MTCVLERSRVGSVEHDLAVAEADDAVGPRDGEVDLVQAADDGEPLVGGDLADERHHLVARLGVERGDRLVGEEDARVLHEGAGDRHALLLAARQGVGALVGAVEQPDAVEVPEGGEPARLRVRPQPEPRAADAGQRAGQHVLEHRQRRHELELLEDEADARRAGRAGAGRRGAARPRRAPRRNRRSEPPARRGAAAGSTCRSPRDRAARRSRRGPRSSETPSRAVVAPKRLTTPSSRTTVSDAVDRAFMSARSRRVRF